MSPYTIVLCKIDSYSCKKAARKSEKTVGKTAVVKAGAYIVSIDKRQPYTSKVAPILRSAYRISAYRPTSACIGCFVTGMAGMADNQLCMCKTDHCTC